MSVEPHSLRPYHLHQCLFSSLSHVDHNELLNTSPNQSDTVTIQDTLKAASHSVPPKPAATDIPSDRSKDNGVPGASIMFVLLYHTDIFSVEEPSPPPAVNKDAMLGVFYLYFKNIDTNCNAEQPLALDNGAQGLSASSLSADLSGEHHRLIL